MGVGCCLGLHTVLGGESTGGESVTIDHVELERMQQSWTDKAEARFKKALREGTGDAYSKSDGRNKRDTPRDRDRDTDKARYDKDRHGGGDRDQHGKGDRTPEPKSHGDRTGKDTRRRESPDKRDKSGDGIQPAGKRSRKTGTMAIGASNGRVDYTKKSFFKLGSGRYFEIYRAACVEVLVKEYNFPREEALKMCFECGLSDFDDCAMCPTPTKKGHTSKTEECHAFPDDFFVVCRKLVQWQGQALSSSMVIEPWSGVTMLS